MTTIHPDTEWYQGERYYFSLHVEGNFIQTIANHLFFRQKIRAVLSRTPITSYTLIPAQGYYCHPDGRVTKERSYILESIKRCDSQLVSRLLRTAFCQYAVLVCHTSTLSIRYKRTTQLNPDGMLKEKSYGSRNRYLTRK